MKALVNACFIKAVALTASLWHTAHAIGRKRFDANEAADLKMVRLNTIRPAVAFTIDPYFFAPLADGDCNEQDNLIPLWLHQHDKTRPRKMNGGLAMSFGYIGYDLPAGVYSDLRAVVGLSSMQTKAAAAVFKVVLGGPPIYENYHTKLVTYGGPVIYESGVIRTSDAAANVVVKLGNAARITLVVECPEGNNHVHAIWGDPVLVKSG